VEQQPEELNMFGQQDLFESLEIQIYDLEEQNAKLFNELIYAQEALADAQERIKELERELKEKHELIYADSLRIEGLERENNRLEDLVTHLEDELLFGEEDIR
jgi:chromosome segregation ATPase